jgi:hypothetical protein
MIILTILAVGALNIACFFIGAKVGQTVAKGEAIKLPTNPIDAARERKAERESRKEAEYERDRIETILHNIDSYDGTGNGQKDVPR